MADAERPSPVRPEPVPAAAPGAPAGCAPPRRHPGPWLRGSPVLVLAALDVGFLFGLWLIVDWLAVRSPGYPANVHDHDGLWPVPLVVVLVANYVFARRARMEAPLRRSLVAFVIALPVTIACLLCFGTWFHLAIGGRL